MVERAASNRRIPQYVTLADVHRMIAVCTEERDRVLIELLWRTGGRISEVLAIRVGDITPHGLRLVNLKQGRWRKLESGAKVHESVREEKHVFVGADFLARLRAYCADRAPGDILIGKLANGKPISRKTAWEIVKAAGMHAGITKRKFGSGVITAPWPHLLRHGHATNLLEAGVPITVVQDQLGHHSLASTQVYTRIVDPRRAELIAGVQF